jgi:hypothetical protein
MPDIKIEICIRAPLSVVWETVADVRTHTEWMADAESITLTSDCSSGVGTTFDCVTRIGPFRTVDRMEITEWVEERTMGVAHRGLISGSGRFTLREVSPSETTFSWEEFLTFPSALPTRGGPSQILRRTTVPNWVACGIVGRIARTYLHLGRQRHPRPPQGRGDRLKP